MPSIAEMTEFCGYRSTKAVRDILRILEREAWISRDSRKARSIRVLAATQPLASLCQVPLLGAIPAGLAEIQTERVEKHIGVNQATLGLRESSSLFALKVHGDSMVGRGIFDGDLAVIDGKGTYADGCVVAALVDGEVTLKTLVDPGNGRKSFLKAENPIYSDIYPIMSLSVQGVVKTIIRTLP